VQFAPSAFIGGGADLVCTSFDGLGSVRFVGKTCLGSFYEETLCKRWNFFGNGIFVDVFEHFCNKLLHKFYRDDNLLGFQVTSPIST
jgi:hypothetical protein